MKYAMLTIAGLIGLFSFGLIACESEGEEPGPPLGEGRKVSRLDLGDGAQMQLLLIPTREFVMGAPETMKGRDNDLPQRRVVVFKPFFRG